MAAGRWARVSGIYASDHAVQRAYRAQRAAFHCVRHNPRCANHPLRPVQLRFPATHAVMLHPDNPPHPVQEFFSHDENPIRIRPIRPTQFSRRNRKMTCVRVRKAEVQNRKMPHILRSQPGTSTEIRRLKAGGGVSSAIKKRFARLSTKASIPPHIF